MRDKQSISTTFYIKMKIEVIIFFIMLYYLS